MEELEQVRSWAGPSGVCLFAMKNKKRLEEMPGRVSMITVKEGVEAGCRSRTTTGWDRCVGVVHYSVDMNNRHNRQGQQQILRSML